MANCPNCQANLPDGTKFCPYCGGSVQSAAAQPSAYDTSAYNTPEPSVVMPPQTEHGSMITDTNPWVQADNDAPAKKKKKGSGGKIALFIVLGLLVVGLLIGGIILAVTLIFGGNDSEGPDYTLFYQDGELYYWDFGRDKPLQVTQDLISDNDYSNSELREFVKYNLAYDCKINVDGDRLFYPDKNNDEKDYNDGYSLYYRNPNKEKSEPVKVDSEVTSYDIDPDGKNVYYIKDKSLYVYNVKEELKDKLASDVTGFALSDDGSRILFANKDNDLYIKVEDNDKEKLTGEVGNIYFDEKLEVIFYFKENALYRHKVGEERQKISSDVNSIMKTYEDGTLYYTKSEKTEITLYSLVDDDLADADSKAVAPVEPERPTKPDISYPYWWNYDTDEEYNAAVEEYNAAQNEYDAALDQYYDDYDAYYDLLDEYEVIERRNNMREELKEAKAERTTYTLYYYNGSEEVKVAEKLTESYAEDSIEASAIVAFYVSDGNVSKVKMSDLYENYRYDYSSHLREQISNAYSGGKLNVAIGTSVSTLEQDDAYGIIIAEDGSAVYYKSNPNEEKDTCDIYKVVIDKSKFGKAETFDTDIADRSLRILNENQVAYFKDYKDGKGDLYVDKNKIDFDVYGSSIQYSEEDKAIVYFSDWNSEKAYGTLKMFKKDEAIKISDDVNSYTIIPSGKILYLKDYSTDKYKGTLYYFEKDESTMIADDVVAEFQCVNWIY